MKSTSSEKYIKTEALDENSEFYPEYYSDRNENNTNEFYNSSIEISNLTMSFLKYNYDLLIAKHSSKILTISNMYNNQLHH